MGQDGERRKKYSAAVIDEIKRNSTIYVGDSIVRTTDSTLNKDEDIVVCLPGARIEHVTERVQWIMGRRNGVTLLVQIHKLAQNIKSDSKNFYAYVRSKQNVRDKVGPLENNAGNIITQGFLMAEELNLHFNSVFTREDTSSLPVPETKINGPEGERLGQLVVTPEVVATKINNMKENMSPGVDGISPKILKETVEQISTPLAYLFNMSLQEGNVPLEWKEANIIPLFKNKVQETSL